LTAFDIYELDKFLVQQNSDDFTTEVIDTIEENDFTEFEELVWYARDNNTALLGLIIERTYFFARYLDSRRHNPKRLEKITERLDEGIDGHN